MADHLDVLDAAVAVAELTDLVDLDGWPPGARLIVRREPLHPGAQQSLSPALEHRYWGHWTDGDGDPVALDVAMRAHARVEDNIRRLRDSGFERFPFVDLDANRAWLAAPSRALGGARNAGEWTSVQTQKLDFVVREPPVDAHECEVLDLGLGDEHAVKGVGMMRR